MTKFGDTKMGISPSNGATKIQTFYPLNFVFLLFYLFYLFIFFTKKNFVFLPQLVGYTSFILSKQLNSFICACFTA